MGAPKGDAGDLFRLLQLLPDSQFDPLHSGNGKWYHAPCLESEGFDCSVKEADLED